MKFYLLLSFTIFVFLFSCQEKNKKTNTHTIKVVEAHGYVVPKDSLRKPNVIPFYINNNLGASIKPIEVTIKPNFDTVHDPEIIEINKPIICTPGLNSINFPKIIIAKPKIAACVFPDATFAKDPIRRDKNSKNFTTYREIEGLLNNNVTNILEDRNGNIWFAFGQLFSGSSGVSMFDGKSFTNFTHKNGMSNSPVLSMLEDKSGNIWFGTKGDGVVKFDGIFFTYFKEDAGLCNNTVICITEDKLGNLWFGTNGGGVSKFDGKSFYNYTIKEGLLDNFIPSIYQDKSGKIWFGGFNGLSVFDGLNFTHFNDKNGIINSFLCNFCEDKLGNIWIGTGSGGVLKYSNNKFSLYNEKNGFGIGELNSIYVDKKGNLWFTYFNEGLLKYNGLTTTWFTKNDGLASNDIWKVLEDKKGNLWFGTWGEGVSKYNGDIFSNLTIEDGLSSSRIMSILKDRTGNLWFGTYGGGLIKYNNEKFENFTVESGLPHDKIYSSMEDKNGNLWFGLGGGGALKYDGKTFNFIYDTSGFLRYITKAIIEDKDGNIWFGSDGGGVIKYDGISLKHYGKKEGMFDNISSIIEDDNGNIWFGSDDGIAKLVGNSITKFSEKEGLFSNDVNSLFKTKNGNIWICTDNGAILFDGKTFSLLNENEGLSNNSVLSVLEDKNGNILFGTHYGISILTKKKLKLLNKKIKDKSLVLNNIFFKNYTYDDCFNGIGGKALCEDNNGIIWIGSHEMLTKYNPSENFIDTIVPNIKVIGINLYNEKINWNNLFNNLYRNVKDTSFVLSNGVNILDFKFDGLTKYYGVPENLNLAYNNNYLTFNFIGITMSQPKNVKYQYMLEGIDENWSAITNRTEAPYGNLPHGIYTFKVKAMNSEGYWSPPFEYKFTIRPPFWQTWWFRSLIGLLIISSIWYYIKSREKKLVVEKQKLEKTVKERTEELVQKNSIVEQQKHLVEVKHKEITDSINYAERIQRSFLATKEILNDNLKNHFVFFQPKDVVSGDFYWATTLREPQGSGINKKFILVTADSTGHGVPGAIMSLLNITSIEAAIKDGFTEPADILNATRKTIVERLKKDGSEEGGKDGMDASLICFDFANNKFTYAAANNPIWVVRNVSSSVTLSGVEGQVENKRELIELKPDKMPVGKHDRDTEPFTQHEFLMQKGDVVYALTDGLPDQFGGPKGKKFMYKQLKELLVSIANEPMGQQKQMLADALNNWKGNLEQVDDVCLIGVRV